MTLEQLLKSFLLLFKNNDHQIPLDHAGNKTILVIDDYVPYHDKSSGSKRLFELLRLFRALNLNVVFLPDDGKATMPYYKELQDLNIEVLITTPESTHLSKLKKKLPFIHYAWISRPALNQKYQSKLHKGTKKIFDTVDLHYLRMMRQSEKQDNPKLKKKALKTKALELALARSGNATITVTAIEKKILEDEGIKPVFVVPNVHEISLYNTEVTFENRKGLLFIGGYKHEPNIDAVKWLINDIMPMVWAELGDIPVYLLGSDPSDEVRSLASDRVFVPGYLSDVSTYFLSGKLFVAPLRYGAGMKGKIGQSLEYGLPVISTSIGTEGMNLKHDVHALVADKASEFAAQIIRLYKDPLLWNKIKSGANDSIKDYSPENVTQKLKDLFIVLDEPSSN